MKPILKYIGMGMIIGGILPAVLHPLKITIFASIEDITAHAISAIIGALAGLIIYKTRNK